MGKRICEKCKEELKDGDKFCQKCGTKVKDVEAKKIIEEDRPEEKEIPIQQSENETKVSSNEEEKKKRKIVIYGIIVTILLVVVSSALLLFIVNDGDKSNSNDKKENDTEEKDSKNDDDTDSEDENQEENKLEDFVLQEFDNGNIIDFYYGTSYTGDVKYSINKPEHTSESIGKIRLENKDCEIFDNFYRFDSNGKVISNITLYRDGDKLKIYDSELNEGLTLKLNSNYQKYEFVLIPEFKRTDTINDILGIDIKDGLTYKKDGYYKGNIENIKTSLFYDLRKEEELFKNTGYYSFKYINNRIIQAYIGYGDSKKTSLLDLSTKKELMSVDTNDEYMCGGINFNGYGDYYVFLGNRECETFLGYEEYLNVDLYTLDLKHVFKNVETNMLGYDEKYLYIRDNNVIHKYDKKGNEVKVYEFDKVLDIFGHFFLVVENGSLLIKDDKNTSIILGEWKDSYKYREPVPGVTISNSQFIGHHKNCFENRQFFLRNNKSQKAEEGIYLIIENNENGVSKDIGYFFNIDTNEVKKYNLFEIEN